MKKQSEASTVKVSNPIIKVLGDVKIIKDSNYVRVFVKRKDVDNQSYYHEVLSGWTDSDPVVELFVGLLNG